MLLQTCSTLYLISYTYCSYCYFFAATFHIVLYRIIIVYALCFGIEKVKSKHTNVCECCLCMLAVYIIKPPNLQVDLVPTLPSFLIAVGPCPLKIECTIPRKERYTVKQLRSLHVNIHIPERLLKGCFIRILEQKEFVVYVYEYEKQAGCGKTESDVHNISCLFVCGVS